MSITKCTFDYSAWCKRQADAIVAAMHDRFTSSDATFFLIPCTPTEEGRLVLTNEKPDAATDCVHLGPHHTWRTIPYSHVHTLVYGACGRYPIIPHNAWSDYKAA